jgi:hypothetical protein
MEREELKGTPVKMTKQFIVGAIPRYEAGMLSNHMASVDDVDLRKYVLCGKTHCQTLAEYFDRLLIVSTGYDDRSLFVLAALPVVHPGDTYTLVLYVFEYEADQRT